MKTIVISFLLISVLVTFTGCFPGGDPNSPHQAAGFFMGVWHGWIAPLSLIVGIFNHDVRIYEANNSGWWYDLGYYVAIIAGFGGVALSRKKKRESAT